MPSFPANSLPWSSVPLISLCLNKGEYGSGAAALNYDSSLPRYVRITDITDDGRLSATSHASITERDAEGYILREGDFLFARSGATVGKTYLYKSVDGRCAHAGYVIKFQLNPQKCDARFVAHWTHSNSYWTWVKRTLRQGAQPNINAEEYAGVQVPNPPLNEQSRIADMLDAYDAHLRAEEAYCDKLRLIKQGVAHDLLTGKVRVNP
jgi:type I restriction enzyme, S subunit